MHTSCLANVIDNTYIVRLKGLLPRAIIAAKAEITGDQLLLTDANGNPAALFLMDFVESWSILPA